MWCSPCYMRHRGTAQEGIQESFRNTWKLISSSIWTFDSSFYQSFHLASAKFCSFFETRFVLSTVTIIRNMDILRGHPGKPVPPSPRQRLQGMGDLVYRNVFRRTSTFLLAIVVGAFFFERTFDMTGNLIFERINKGKLWKDIKHNYEGKTPAVEEEEPAEESE